MRVIVLVCLGAALTSARGSESDRACVAAIRLFNSALISPGGDASAAEQALGAHLKEASPGIVKSLVFQFDRGFNRKYRKNAAFHAAIARMMASGGSRGISKLFQRYKSSSKNIQLRVGIAQALGGCGDPRALSTLLKVMYDKAPEVAVAAVTGCGAYAKVDQAKRKAAMAKLIKLYRKVTDGAAGKAADAREMVMYRDAKPAFDATLSALSGGEKLDSAGAWDGWLRENKTRNWDKH